MKVGDLVEINDLCRNPKLVGTVGTVVEIGIKEPWHSSILASVLTTQGLVRFKEGTPQLEIIT